MSNLEFNVLKDEFPIKNKKKSNSLRSFFENKKNGLFISPENKIAWQRYLETLGTTAACLTLEKKLWEHDDLHDYQISHKIITKFSTLISDLENKFQDKKDTLYKHIVELFYKEVKESTFRAKLNNEDIRSYLFNILKSKHAIARNIIPVKKIERSLSISKKIS